MKINVLASGSHGNCAIITDSLGCQLILDCGIKYDNLSTEINWDKPVSVLISHKHSDHYNPLTMKKLKMLDIPIFDESCFEDNMAINSQYWKILTIKLPHSVDTHSWAFLMYHTIDRKTVFFATDCRELPRLSDRPMDLIMVENNYSEIKVVENICANRLTNLGYTNHLSAEYVFDWLSKRKSICKNLLITHLSNSDNISLCGLSHLYDHCAQNVYIATKKLSFNF